MGKSYLFLVTPEFTAADVTSKGGRVVKFYPKFKTAVVTSRVVGFEDLDFGPNVFNVVKNPQICKPKGYYGPRDIPVNQ